VFCFGILTDFRARLFEGSARLVELADRTHALQVESLCWCGRRATHNARTLDGEMVTEGDVVVLGDTVPDAADRVGYEVLCRRHHRKRMTSARAGAVSLTPVPLPFGTARDSGGSDLLGDDVPGRLDRAPYRDLVQQQETEDEEHHE
jgi:thymidine kinase